MLTTGSKTSIIFCKNYWEIFSALSKKEMDQFVLLLLLWWRASLNNHQHFKEHIHVQIWFGENLFSIIQEDLNISVRSKKMKNEIIFLENRNILFPDNWRKTIFQCEFLGKTTFSEHLQKISYFHAFFLRKIFFHFPSEE